MKKITKILGNFINKDKTSINPWHEAELVIDEKGNVFKNRYGKEKQLKVLIVK